MSRHIQKTGTKTIAYGFDPMPGGGYFFQVFDTRFITDENDEGIVINEGFFNGLPKKRMLDLMTEHSVNEPLHIELVELGMPI